MTDTDSHAHCLKWEGYIRNKYPICRGFKTRSKKLRAVLLWDVLVEAALCPHLELSHLTIEGFRFDSLSTPPELVASACQKEPGRRHHSLSPVPCKQQKSSSTSASSSRKSHHRLHCRLLQKTTSEVRAKPAPVRLFPVFPHSSNAELSTPTPHGQSRHSTA